MIRKIGNVKFECDPIKISIYSVHSRRIYRARLRNRKRITKAYSIKNMVDNEEGIYNLKNNISDQYTILHITENYSEFFQLHLCHSHMYLDI